MVKWTATAIISKLGIFTALCETAYQSDWFNKTGFLLLGNSVGIDGQQ
jgi:hypothetical protein